MIAPPELFAHAARRLCLGRPDIAEFRDALPDGALRRRVVRLEALPPEQRPADLDQFLDARDDGPAIRKAMVDVDPDAPPPADDADPDDGWGSPRLDRPFEAAPFPLDVLPLSARNMVQEAARSVGCPIDFPAAAALAVVAGIIGRSASLRLKEHYFASPALWIAAVGPPSDGKSPAVDLIFRATSRIDDALLVEHDQAMVEWRDRPPGEDGKRPSPPRPRRIDVDDCTTEALIGVMADNNRGLIQFKDELAGFLHGMDQYRAGGKGSDRPKYLSIWSGKRIKIDRAKHEANIPIRVPHPCLTLFGPLVPDSLAALSGAQGGSDGFLDRFLFSYPEQLPVPDWTERGVEDSVVAAWEELVFRVWSRPLADGDGGPHPHVVYMNGPRPRRLESLPPVARGRDERPGLPGPLPRALGQAPRVRWPARAGPGADGARRRPQRRSGGGPGRDGPNRRERMGAGGLLRVARPQGARQDRGEPRRPGVARATNHRGLAPE